MSDGTQYDGLKHQWRIDAVYDFQLQCNVVWFSFDASILLKILTKKYRSNILFKIKMHNLKTKKA